MAEEIMAAEPTITLEQQEEEFSLPSTLGMPVQRESSAEDYWNIVNPAAIPYNNPTLKFNASTDIVGDLGFNDEDFQAVYSRADTATKRAMLQANNKNDALKIADRREIFMDSMRATEEDGMMTQLGMSLLPAVASPSSLLPAGSVFKAAQIAKTTSRLQTGLLFGSVGAGTGAIANVMDEALFDLQGMPTNYLGAAGMGAIFGGFLGGLGGALSGPQSKNIANAIAPENDTFTRDYTTDPSVILELDENGIHKIADIGQMDKSLIDRIPWIGEALRSDVHTVYQSDSSLLRGFMARMSDPTVALKDSQGNLVVNKKTAKNFQRELKGFHNNLTDEVSQLHEMARSEGYTGNIETFNEDIWKFLVDEMNKQKNALVEYKNQSIAGMPTEGLDEAGKRALFKKVRDAEKEFYDNYTINFGDSHIGKAAESHRIYFERMLKQGQAIGLKGVKDIHPNRLYVPRTYNYKGIHRGTISQEVLRAEVRAGLEHDRRNSGMSVGELEDAVEGIVQMLNESSFDLNNLTTSFMVKDLPFEGRLKQKKLYLNESKMPNVLNSNLGDLTGAYHYQMQGRQGLQFAFGTDKVEEVMKLVRQEHLDKGIIFAEKEVQAFERTVQDVLGTLRMNQLADTPSWTFTRNLTSYNSARLGGGFGGNQFIELVSSIAMQGTKALMSGRLLKSLGSTKDLLYMKRGTKDEFTQFLINSGYMENALHTSRINRYADTESGFNSGWLENKLNFLNDKLMKYNGMRYFLGVMEDYTGGAIVTQLKSGNMPLKRLARWGLSEADAKNLSARLKEVTKGEEWDLGALTQLERDQLQLAITKGIEEIVVQGDSIHLPAWMKAPGQFTKVLTQFMRFPLVAQETLLRRGMKDEQAQLVAGVFSSIATFMAIKYLREQAAMATGSVHPIDAKYDYENFSEDDWLRVTGEALNYTAPLGFMTSIWNYGAVAVGSPELGREWQSKNGMSSLLGPSGGLGEDLIQLMRSGAKGELTTERDFKRFRSLVPFMNLPLIKEGSDIIIQEYGD